MRVMDVSLIGWIHTVACIVALVVGVAILTMAKGTARHKSVGLWYFYAMIAANLTVLGLYKPVPGLPPGFNVFHWFAIITLMVVVLGCVAASRQRSAVWAYVHPSCMVLSYYALVAGGINEVIARAVGLNVSRPSALAGTIHGAAIVTFIAVLAYFLGKVSGQRMHIQAAMARVK